MKIAQIAFLAFAMSGCVAASQPTKLNFAPDLKVLERINLKGTGKIEGQAFMRQMGGGVVTAAGEKVGLIVATPFTNEVIGVFLKGGTFDAASDVPNFKDYLRYTTADASGNFTFDQLASGDYIVLTSVNWSVPTGRYGVSQEGGPLVDRVTVSSGKTTKIIMSR